MVHVLAADARGNTTGPTGPRAAGLTIVRSIQLKSSTVRPTSSFRGNADIRQRCLIEGKHARPAQCRHRHLAPQWKRPSRTRLRESGDVIETNSTAAKRN